MAAKEVQALAGARDVLVAAPVSTLLKPQHVVTLPHSATVALAMRKLAQHKLLSAPMLDAEQKPAGFCDVRALLGSFLALVRAKEGVEEGHSLGPSPMLSRMRELEKLGELYAGEGLAEALARAPGCEDGAYVFAAQATTKLSELVADGFLCPPRPERAGKPAEPRGEHRLGIFDSEGAVINVVSQSDVVAYLFQHADKFPALCQTTVRELGFVPAESDCVTPGIIGVKPERPALEALELCYEAGVQAVGVVDSSGVLVANFSVSDFRGVEPEHFGVLALPVAEFLALAHGATCADYAASASKHAAHAFFAPGRRVGQELKTCCPETTFGELLEMFVRHRMHRVYVCEGLKPIGVVTLTDMLSTLS